MAEPWEGEPGRAAFSARPGAGWRYQRGAAPRTPVRISDRVWPVLAPFAIGRERHASSQCPAPCAPNTAMRVFAIFATFRPRGRQKWQFLPSFSGPAGKKWQVLPLSRAVDASMAGMLASGRTRRARGCANPGARVRRHREGYGNPRNGVGTPFRGLSGPSKPGGHLDVKGWGNPRNEVGTPFRGLPEPSKRGGYPVPRVAVTLEFTADRGAEGCFHGRPEVRWAERGW
jgi:hypothetical protein